MVKAFKIWYNSILEDMMTENLMFAISKNAKKMGIAVLLIFLLMSIIINQVSIVNHKNEIAKKHKFIDLENRRVDQYQSYFLFARFGIRLIAISSPINILFCDSNTFPGDLISSFNSFEKMEISKPYMGKNLSEKPAGGVLDFSWFLFTIGSIIVLSFGWLLFQNTEHLKYLIASSKIKRLWGKIILQRIAMLITSLFLILLVTGLQMWLNGIWNSESLDGLLSLLLVSTLFMLPLLLFSSITGTIKSKVFGFMIVVLAWFLVLFLLPKMQNSLLSQSSDNIINPIIDHENKKMEIVMNFETKFAEEMKKHKIIDSSNKSNEEIIGNFLTDQYRELEKFDLKMIKSIDSFVRKFHFWSIFNPATFYKSVNNELSSRGYVSYLSFYRDLQEKQRRFLNFYIKKRFYEKSKKVEPFLEDDEYIFKLKSSLPAFFAPGVFVQIFYILVLLVFSYFRFRTVIFSETEKKEQFSGMHLEFKRGKHYKIEYESNEFPEQIFNVFAGKASTFPGKISIDDRALIENEKQDFVYLPSPGVFPANAKIKKIMNHTVKSWGLPEQGVQELLKELDASLVNKRFRELEEPAKIELLIKLAKLKKSGIYILNNLFSSISRETEDEFYSRVFAELKKDAEDSLILELSPPFGLIHTNFDFYSSINKKGSKYIERKIKE